MCVWDSGLPGECVCVCGTVGYLVSVCVCVCTQVSTISVLLSSTIFGHCWAQVCAAVAQDYINDEYSD